MKRLVFWTASLVVVAMAALALAQNRFAQPQMLSGGDIGFRVEGTDLRGRPTGTLMVRFNGNWVEVGSTLGVRPAK